MELPLIDHHCHGVLRNSIDRATFEANLTEAAGPGRWHPTMADTQAGLAVRTICGPALDLPAHVGLDDYLARREELGVDDVNRRLLGATGIEQFLVDTGLTPESITTPSELAGYAGGTGHEIVRLEAVAESVIRTVDPGEYADAVAAALADRVSGAVGVKSIAAYRGGLDLDPARPTASEVAAAAASWQASLGDAGPRLIDRTLIRQLIWTAVDLGKPIQFHVGYGDADVDLYRCTPTLLTPLLRATAGLGVPVLLLHNYPFHREAGYLAQVFDHVFVDVGLALQNVGSRADTVLAELLELAPFSAVLFSTDGYALPELFTVHTTLFRRALGRFLDDGLQREHWSAADAERIAGMIASGNARRAYGLTAG